MGIWGLGIGDWGLGIGHKTKNPKTNNSIYYNENSYN